MFPSPRNCAAHAEPGISQTSAGVPGPHDPPIVQQQNPIRDPEGFLLIVRDVERGNSRAIKNEPQLDR